MDRRRGSQAARACAGPRRVAVPERRRQADGSRGPPSTSRRPSGPHLRAAEHHPLGQVDRHRKGAGRSARRARPTTWRSATTSQSTASGSSTTATSSSFTSRRTGAHAARSARGRREVPGPVERRRGGSRRGSGLRCRGNTWFLPYDTIQSRDKERPHPATFPWRLPGVLPRLHGVPRRRPGRRSVPRTGQFRRGMRARWG